jgi:hypothetical protein
VEDDSAKMSLFCVEHTVPIEAETHVCKLYGAMRGCGSDNGFARICKKIELFAMFRLQTRILLETRFVFEKKVHVHSLNNLDFLALFHFFLLTELRSSKIIPHSKKIFFIISAGIRHCELPNTEPFFVIC